MYRSMMPPEATVPAMTYFIVAGKAFSNTHTNLHKLTRFQTNTYAARKSTVETISAALVNHLHRYTGTVSGQDIVYIVQDYEMDTFEPETQMHRKIIDFKVVHKGT